jgi:hypothetical protein
MEEKKCRVLVLRATECGLPLTPVKSDDGNETDLYQCPEGHRSQFVPEEKKPEENKST